MAIRQFSERAGHRIASAVRIVEGEAPGRRDFRRQRPALGGGFKLVWGILEEDLSAPESLIDTDANTSTVRLIELDPDTEDDVVRWRYKRDAEDNIVTATVYNSWPDFTADAKFGILMEKRKGKLHATGKSCGEVVESLE